MKHSNWDEAWCDGGAIMKRIRFVGMGILLIILGSVAPTYAQQEQHEQEAKPEKQEQQKAPQQAKGQEQQKQPQQAKPEKQQQQKAPQQAKGQEQQKQPQQAKPEKQQQQKAPQQAKGQEQQKQPQQAKPEKQQQQKAPQQAKGPQGQQAQQHPQRSAAEVQKQRSMPALRLSARGTGRIPDDRFRANFGSGHRFHIGTPQMVGGYSRFQYGGFWFGFVDPWPATWYYDDDVYIEYVDGGYYLFNPYYPGVRIAITVYLS
jgi:hypothetical protein